MRRRAYAYAPGTNRLAEITRDGAVERRFAYDGAGHLTRDERADAQLTYGPDASGQLAQVRVGPTPERERARYTYDGRRRLAIRSLLNGVPEGTTHLIYDAADRLIAETDAAGVTLREYVWLDALPVAVLDGTQDPHNPVLLFVQADHLARPVLMTDAAGQAVWRASYDPFGAVAAITGPASLDLRFPGQWFQLETGLHYNWHRHYDPSTGRYTAPDPLGFADGPSVYAYARQSPLMYVDPTGEIGVGGAIFGASANFGIQFLVNYANSRDARTAFYCIDLRNVLLSGVAGFIGPGFLAALGNPALRQQYAALAGTKAAILTSSGPPMRPADLAPPSPPLAPMSYEGLGGAVKSLSEFFY